MAYTIISTLCIVGMVGILIYLIARFCSLKRAGKIEFIKSFKKGKCAAIYCIAIPLYFMAAIYSGKTVVVSIFEAISKAVYLVVLKYDYSAALIDDNAVFAAALYMCFALVVVNAFMIVISILHKQIWRNYRIYKFRRTRGDKCIIIGNNETSRQIYSSCRCKKMLLDVMSVDACEKLYVAGITYREFDGKARIQAWINVALKKLLQTTKKSGNKINLIINTTDEHKNIDLSGMFLEFIGDLSESDISHIDIYVFGQHEHANIYESHEKKSRGCLHYIEEYTQLAIDFISNHPLTQYMDKRQIDYESALIRPDVDINVAMIGFGRTNRQLFLSMLANNQFLTIDEKGNKVCKQVGYHLFDGQHTKNRICFNDDYFRFEHDYNIAGGLKDNAEKYLPFPESPEKHFYHSLNLNDLCFYDELKEALSFRKNSVNTIIVALGDDYLNIEVGKKIATKVNEWQCDNCKIFVRVRNKKIFKVADTFFDSKRCTAFGDEDSIYDYRNIIHEQFNEMAIMRNCIYDIEHDMQHDVITEDEKIKSKIKWYTQRSSIERWSNAYACLSLKSKLHLMGLDYRKAESDDDKGISYEEFISVYAVGDKPKLEIDETGALKAIRYSLDFPDSKRKNLAIQEHNRWNAYMLMKGFIPATKEQIIHEEEHGKNYAARTHCNLTTFEGLTEYRKMVADAENRPEEDVDVIKYDYQLLDGAWWLLTKNGFKIVKRD